MKPPRVMVLHAPGTNRDREAALACERASGNPEIVHINQLITSERRLGDYQMLVLPGGFSYGDDLGAGRLWANDLYHRFKEALDEFVCLGKPVMTTRRDWMPFDTRFWDLQVNPAQKTRDSLEPMRDWW